jgi:hypothetical protein
MNDFWNNISRYPRFFISSLIGLILIILSPFRNLFSIGLWIWMLCGAIGVYLFSKETLFFTFNQLHSYPGDLFFQYFTHVGDGLMMLAPHI